MRNILIAAVTILAAAGMIRAEQTCPVRTIPLDSGWRLPPEARIAGAGGRPVLTRCLLYTSPSPRDLG